MLVGDARGWEPSVFPWKKDVCVPQLPCEGDLIFGRTSHYLEPTEAHKAQTQFLSLVFMTNACFLFDTIL